MRSTNANDSNLEKMPLERVPDVVLVNFKLNTVGIQLTNIIVPDID